MRSIVEALLSAPLPVIVYVAPPGAAAASAGMFVTLAANLAAMAPGTSIGAAHPVQPGGGAPVGAEGRKVVNFTAAMARSIALHRGRNQAWVEQAVRGSVAANDQEALALHVIDLVARDLPDLLFQASGRQVEVNGSTQVLLLTGVPIIRHTMTFPESLLDKLADPDLAYLLLMAGLVGLYLEFAHPGLFAPGIVGAICLFLALAGLSILPINFMGALLLILGLGFLGAEAFVPTYGVVGVSGLIAFVIGAMFLIDPSRSDLLIGRGVIALGAAALLMVVLLLSWSLGQRRRPPRIGPEAMVGERGEVCQAIAPGHPGWIALRGEIWRAVSDCSLPEGTEVEVIAVDGLELTVKPAVANPLRSAGS
jgi:membrane-bound serine protease (ClpP class)